MAAVHTVSLSLVSSAIDCIYSWRTKKYWHILADGIQMVPILMILEAITE